MFTTCLVGKATPGFHVHDLFESQQQDINFADLKYPFFYIKQECDIESVKMPVGLDMHVRRGAWGCWSYLRFPPLNAGATPFRMLFQYAFVCEVKMEGTLFVESLCNQAECNGVMAEVII